MSIWDKQQNWIKDILSKSGTEIKEINNDDKNELRKQMVYYTALPLIMKSENGGPTQLCLNQNQIMMNDSGAFNGSPSSQQAQLINLQNGDINGGSPSHQQQNNYTYQLLTSVDHQQLQQNSQQLHQQQQQQQQQQQPQQTQQQQNVPQMQSVHNGRVPKQTKSFKCDQCNMNFGSKSAHTSHIKSHAKQQQQQSPSSSSSLASSNLSSVNSGSSNTTQMQSSDPYQCDVCKKTFAVPARLVRHYRTHTGERPFECEFCHKMFSVKENLQVHRRIHTKERPYKCDVCGRAFEHSGKLHRHMRIHTGERPHKCNVCGKTFIQSGQLVIHMRTHTGEKPYKCPVEGCGKGFTCSKQLKVHSRTHTGEKPYHCDICFRDFGYNHVLKLHRVQHYGSKCYKCTICDETFKNKKEMEAHIKGHANEMPDDDHNDDISSMNQSPKHQQQLESKNNILLTPSSSSSSLSSSPNTSLSHPIITKYELNDNLMNFVSSDQNMATPINAVTTIYPDTPKDSEASSEQNSDGDDMTYLNMYSRFEQSVVNSYGVNSGVSSALLAAASITAAATIQPITISAPSTINNTNSSTLITLSPIQQNSTNQQLNNMYESSQMGLMRQNNGYFGANGINQVSDFKSSNLVRCVEAALEMTPPRSSPRSSPESPDRSSSPESDSVQLADRDNNTLPPRKRKLYFKDNQSTGEQNSESQMANKSPSQGFPRMSSVIHFAKAS